MIAIYPGSFNPFTVGHESIVKKALSTLPNYTIIIAIGVNPDKVDNNIDRNLKEIQEIYKKEKRVEVISYKGLTVDYCRSKGIKTIIRGIRNIMDFENEKSLYQINKSLDSEIETVYFMADQNLSHVSSSLIRELEKEGKNINHLKPKKK